MQLQIVADVSQVAEMRRAVTDLAANLGFDETAKGRAALVATELATNLLKHGGGGEALIGPYEDATGFGVQIIALDKGSGFEDLGAALKDGYSTAGTAGHGLGSIRRQSQVCEIVTWPALGSAVLARVAKDPSHEREERHPAWGGITVPYPGESVCGDSFVVLDSAAGLTMLVADGLGHGPEAATAAQEAARLFRACIHQSVPQLLESIHLGLRATRGAAIAVARFSNASTVTFGGIGNIAGAVIENQQMRRMVSLNGTAGHNARKIQTFDYHCNDGIVVLASDGLGTHWSMDRYPGLTAAHPSLAAAVLYRDHSRRRDDTCVVVARRMH